jgi:peptide/nickel transport system substrate-binding protein
MTWTFEPEMPRTRLPRLAIVLASLAFAAAPAHSQRTLTIAATSEPTSLDPHFHNTIANYATARQIFNPLPDLSESRRQLDDRTWEFRLREGVRFHDGTPIEAEDVAFSYSRAAAIKGSPASFASNVSAIAAVEVADPRTVRVRAREPSPFLLGDIFGVMVLSRRVHAGATTAGFDGGRLAIGTGPYRHVAYIPAERHEVAANPDFWGGRPPWDRVTTRYVAEGKARLAALTSGDVDLIDGVPSREVQRLSDDPRFAVFGVDSNITAFLFPDAARGQVPHVTDRQGRPLDRNPLADRRVREALSLAIDREGIVQRTLHGQGKPAEQFGPPGAAGRAPDMPPLPHDPAAARRLLAEAGYPEGFRLTIHGLRADFGESEEVLGAIAEEFSRIGVETRTETVPAAAFGRRGNNREFAAFLYTYSGGAVYPLRGLALTRNPGTGAGAFNWQHYSNPGVDAPMAEASRTMDAEQRTALIAQAQRALVEDKGLIPVLYLRNNWAGRRDRVRYEPHRGGHTSAVFTSPVDLSGR